jgi:PAS domain-containing protein
MAVVVVDREGLVAQWGGGACRLFGVTEKHALGRPALDLLPVSGAFPFEDERDARAPRRAAGRAWLSAPDGDRVDVLWWAYPLPGSGRDGLLVLAADATGLPPAGAEWRLALDPMAPCDRTAVLEPACPRR